jgi:membrane protein
VTLADLKHALVRTFLDVIQNHTMLMAAALSYYFVLSLFPALVFLSAGLAYLPFPDLLDSPSSVFAHLLPADAMTVIAKAITDVVGPHKATLLSFGVVGTLWAASGGFSAAIEALDVAYDANDNRPFWVTRSLALGLTFVTGILFLIAFGVMIVGPQFGEWLAARIHLSRLFVLLWPAIHWTIAIAFTVLAVEALYFFAPNIKQRFLATLPGAVLAVGCWIGMSYLLGIYFRHFAHFDRTYGTLGAAIALMVWLYWTGFAMLVGAELNAELAKRSRLGRLQQKQPSSNETPLDSAA